MSSEEKVSNNAKIVLLGLFGLVGGIIGMVSYVFVVGDSIPEQLSGIFIAAVTGAFTLGGTLIQNLWGK